MKKLIQILLLFSFCFSLVACSSSTDKEDMGIPALLERKATFGPKEEADNITTTYTKSLAALKTNPDDLKQYLTLATVFIAEGRITGNASYYSNASVKMLDRVIDNAQGNKDLLFQALSLKSTVLLNMHQFKDALVVAERGETLNGYNSGIYGALVDANVELGKYDEAVKDCDKMLGLRPDLRSYSRASYLRQIYGDNAGAIAAMTMAVQAGVPGAESTEWARVNLGDLYMNIGKIDSANLEYRTSLVYRANYPYAQMGMSRVEKAKKNYDGAIADAKAAITTMSEAAFVSYLGDLYALKGDNTKAEEVRTDVINLMIEGEKEQPKDASVKHNINREMAMAYMNANQLDKALGYAQNDLNMRPDNIDANELIAWIYYMKGDYANAKVHADKMLVTKTKNANTLFKAGAIYSKAGDAAKGNELVLQAKALNPYIDQKVVNESKLF